MIKIQRLKVFLYFILSISIISGCQDVDTNMTTFNGYNLNHSYWMEDGSTEYSTNIYYFHDSQVTEYSFNKKDPSDKTYTCTTKGPYTIHLYYDKIEIENGLEDYFILKRKQDKFQLTYTMTYLAASGTIFGYGKYMRNYHPITSIPSILTEK